MPGKEALFFCSANRDINPKYNQAARAIVRVVSSKGYGIASGGTIKGTMSVICEEASACGAEVRGALPRFMEGLEHPCLTRLDWTETMSQRKDRMREGTDVAIALPGGIGTLDELAETICLFKMGLYGGRVIIFNMDGYYDHLKGQLERFVEEGMFPQDVLDRISFPKDLEELSALI